jgi:hypothetical protein
MDEIERVSRETDVALKRRYATRLLNMLRWQFIVTNAVFVIYAWAGVHWKIPDAVISSWFGATVIELVSMVGIVTAYLFPRPKGDA